MTPINKERLVYAAIVLASAAFYFTCRPERMVVEDKLTNERVQAMNSWLDAGMKRHGKN